MNSVDLTNVHNAMFDSVDLWISRVVFNDM